MLKPAMPDGQPPNAVTHAIGAVRCVDCYARLKMTMALFFSINECSADGCSLTRVLPGRFACSGTFVSQQKTAILRWHLGL